MQLILVEEDVEWDFWVGWVSVVGSRWHERLKKILAKNI
jgi:hypothetical protein